MPESLWKQLDKKENRFPDHHIVIMRVGKNTYVKIRQPGYGTLTYNFSEIGDAIEECPEDVKRYIVLHKAYNALLKELPWNK